MVLNFDGLHVACVWGPNGAGKSSLLEAIAWCVWGQSRVNAEDDIVRQGSKETRVSFSFIHDGHRYRIIRTRRRNQASELEFQIQTGQIQTGQIQTEGSEDGYKSLTQKGVRATQRYILQQIKIDYETFVNSAYLRQGRADEFMLKRPSERKQVLADLLKLDQYDRLAEQAKEQFRQYKAQLQPVEGLLSQLSVQIESCRDIQQDYDVLQAQVETGKKHEQTKKRALKQLKKRKTQQMKQQQELALLLQKEQHQRTTLETCDAELAEKQQQFRQVEEILSQSENIEQNYGELEALRDREEKYSEHFQAYQQAQAQRLHTQQQLNQQKQQHQIQLAQLTTQLTQLTQQEQDIRETLTKKDDILHKLHSLKQAKKQLHHFDKTEAQSAPLRQRFNQIQGQIEQAHTRLSTRIEELDSRQTQMSTQQAQAVQLKQSAIEISHRLAYLEQRREYQEAVRQKGIERRNFMERLQANQLNHEISLAKFEQTLQLLADPDEAHCPLCEQALKGKTWEELRDRTTEERNEVQNQIWAIREQLAVSESEIQVLRQEYRVLEEELEKYAPFLEERGRLMAQLASVDTLQQRLQAMSAERAQLERCLEENGYAEELQTELQRIESQIAEMAYDDRDHALVRSQVDRLRWSELKHAEIEKAERQLEKIQAEKPKIEEKMREIEGAIATVESSPLAKTLIDLDSQLTKIDYSLTVHNQLRAQIRQARIWQERHQALQQAKSQQSELTKKIDQLSELCKTHSNALTELEQQTSSLQTKVDKHSDVQEEITSLETELANVQSKREQQLSQLGRVLQQLSQLEMLEVRHSEQVKNLADIRHKYQVYQALAQAFGRNGIQALMIENLLPQLEAKTNQILGKLSNHQLHVQFVTQRTGRNRKKLIDTLDILIADARGTRPYETYSGGEAFRVNFSIRLAIAQLLALRSGTALQMLIVDEGFGTQDRAGCDRLIAAINAIAPDFACILTITHMPHFREAFQTRIDVFKDEDGSHIVISG